MKAVSSLQPQENQSCRAHRKFKQIQMPFFAPIMETNSYPAQERIMSGSGRYLCGAAKFKFEGKPLWSGFCHCESCRRNCAAPVAAFFGVANENYRWLGTHPTTYKSFADVTRHFCAKCGTPMAYEAERFPGKIHFYATTLDQPADFKPNFHVHYKERVEWLHITDDLPKYQTTSLDGNAE